LAQQRQNASCARDLSAGAEILALAVPRRHCAFGSSPRRVFRDRLEDAHAAVDAR
jgi:hypothetical protein